MIAALEKYDQMTFIVSKANADFQGDIVNRLFEEAAHRDKNVFCFASLGLRRYLSLLKHAKFVIGNSSSGIVEAPCFGIPTINIGSRQKGRLKAESIIDCEPVSEDILSSMKKALSPEFRETAKNAKNPYGDGDTSRFIVSTMKQYLKESKIDLKKKFYDMGEV